MNLSTTSEKLELVLAGNITTNQLMWFTSYSTLTSSGLQIPKSSAQGLSNGTSTVEIVGAPSSNITRVVSTIMVFNSDTVAAQVTIKKDVGGTEYIIIKALLQSNDTLQYTEAAGWSILKQNSQESVLLREYTANSTWTKPQGLSRILVACLGAGGGGGSGRRGATSTNRYGGGGGGGGAIVYRQISNDGLLGSYAITIGTGGTGGAGATVDDTTNNGTAGTDTSFGSVVVAKGGAGGAGGTAIAGAAGAGGAIATCIPPYSPYTLPGAAGGTGSQANGAAGAAGYNATGAPGGGGGGGISNANASSTTGGAGGGVYLNGVLQAGAASGASPNGGNNISTSVMLSTSLTSAIGLGTAGAGGYHTSYPTFINGGNGGSYGAGGGGGAASLNGNISGKGGDGAGGMCLVMEFY